MAKFIFSLLATFAIIIATSLPSFAQSNSSGVRRMPTGVMCARCTMQCTMCGLGDKCKATCNANGNGWVKYGRNYCTNWFDGCNDGK
ncbi:hypothetical protein [Bradyrhizobium sp. URHC0002]